MLSFAKSRLPEQELQIAYSIGHNSLTDGVTGLGNVQDRVIENVLGAIVQYLYACGDFIDGLPVDYEVPPKEVLDQLCALLVSTAMEEGLLVDTGDCEEDVYAGV